MKSDGDTGIGEMNTRQLYRGKGWSTRGGSGERTGGKSANASDDRQEGIGSGVEVTEMWL